MSKLILLLIILSSKQVIGQVASNITFMHEGKIIYGTITKPNGTGKFPVIIIGPGSGANDRNGTIHMVGGNIECLYPQLLNDTLKPYMDLALGLTKAGFAVLRYDKVEYTYTSDIGTITFEKLWLPITSAIDYVRTRNDIDTQKIIIIGHSEGSSIAPFIASKRNDVAALISIAGSRTPFDSILAKQLLFFATNCNGDVNQATNQGNQILGYCNAVRNGQWNSQTPPLFGVPAKEWEKYFEATDSVAYNYEKSNVPTLFIGLGLDINVPPSELERFKDEVKIPKDVWSIPNLIHYMTPNDSKNVSQILIDTLVFWLNTKNLTSIDTRQNLKSILPFRFYPNPAQSNLMIDFGSNNPKKCFYEFYSLDGKLIRNKGKCFINDNSYYIDINNLPEGVYTVNLFADEVKFSFKFTKSNNN